MKKVVLAIVLTTSLDAWFMDFFYPSSSSLFTDQNNFMVNLAKFITICKKIDKLDISGRELGRTVYQQKRYLQLGLSKTLNSKHLENLAIDMEFRYEGKIITATEHHLMRAIADIWESIDSRNESGYFWFFKDAGHFQYNR